MLRGEVLPERLRLSRGRWRALAAALSAIVLLVAAPTAYAGDTRIGINGARPSELPGFAQILGGAGFTKDGWLGYANRVGDNWLPGMTPVPLDYPAQLGTLWGVGALSGDKSLAAGQQALHATILDELAKGNNVSVVGLSLGTMVIDRQLIYLHSLPDSEALPADRITFYVFGGETRGFGETYARNVRVPLLGVTFKPVPETRYNTVVVYGQWDGWAAPPDRPWNALAVMNAVMGALYTVNGTNDHSSAAKKGIEDAVLVSDYVNSLGGRTTTYMIPESSLPITRPLRQLGVPGWLVDRLNTLLMPLIAAGYSSMTPQLGWHVSKGRLVWKSPKAPISPPVEIDQDADGGDTPAPEFTAAAASSESPAGDEAAAEETRVEDLQDEDPEAEVDLGAQADLQEPVAPEGGDLTDGDLTDGDLTDGGEEPSRAERLAELGLAEPDGADAAQQPETKRDGGVGGRDEDPEAEDDTTEADKATDTPAAA